MPPSDGCKVDPRRLRAAHRRLRNFCAAALEPRRRPHAFLAAVYVAAATTAVFARPFAPPDVVCALFCASHKSLTLGIPVLRIVFPDHPDFGRLSAPLLMYHPIQIVLGGLLVPAVRNWADAAASRAALAETPETV